MSLVESLSPIERKIIPFLDKSLKEIEKKSGLDATSVMRALQFLEKKKALELIIKRTIIIELGVNGILYKKNHLPERKVLAAIEKTKRMTLEEAYKASDLSDNEFKAALGALKKKALIELNQGKIILNASKEELIKKFPEELLIEALPKAKDDLTAEEQFAFENLKNRKNMVELKEDKHTSIKLTDVGRKLMTEDLQTDLIEELTPEIIKEGLKGRKFRRYDLHASAPKLHGGKTHFVNQARDKARRIWLDLGFTEMEGPMVDSSFWVFDALFTAQDHPVREMQDSFYIKGQESTLPAKEIVERVRAVHEKGTKESRGWNYAWNKSDAEKVVMRTHTTSLSARTLATLDVKKLPAKYFAIGKAFRNETIDWSHGIEFYQSEGIVIDPTLTFRHLLGYLREFYKKMGFEQIRFRPSFFPYTEPSVEIDVFHAKKGLWLELGGAGILRPEVVEPLLGKKVPVLAWGQGLDRTIMDAYAIQDLREVYANDIELLRNKPLSHG